MGFWDIRSSIVVSCHSKSSTKKTTTQPDAATRNRLPLNQATSTPATRAASPDQRLSVAWRMAGKVMAASFALECIPLFASLASGTRIILLTVVIAAGAALLFPVKEEEKEGEGHGA